MAAELRFAKTHEWIRPDADGLATVGIVTSGSFCPSLGSAAAQALVDRDVAATGTALDVLVRDTPQPATVAPLPFVRRPRPRT